MSLMNLEPVIPSEVSQKEKQISYSNAFIWNLENGIYEPICRCIHIEQTCRHSGGRKG